MEDLQNQIKRAGLEAQTNMLNLASSNCIDAGLLGRTSSGDYLKRNRLNNNPEYQKVQEEIAKYEDLIEIEKAHKLLHNLKEEYNKLNKIRNDYNQSLMYGRVK